MSGQATGWVIKYGPVPTDLDVDGQPVGMAGARARRAVLGVIADAANRFGHRSHPGRDAIIDGSLYSRSQARRILIDLKAEGWITIDQEGGGRGLATEFSIPGVDVPGWVRVDEKGVHHEPRQSEPQHAKGVHPPPERGPLSAKGVHLDGPPTVSTTVNTPTSLFTDPVGASEPPVLDRFDEFWKAYPRHEAKKAAVVAYQRALKSVPADKIITAARQYAHDTRDREKRHVAQAVNWLKGERWDDDPMPVRVRVNGNGAATGARRPIDTDRTAPSTVTYL